MVKHLRSRKRNNKSLRRRKTRSRKSRKSRRSRKLTHRRKISKRRSTRKKRKIKGGHKTYLRVTKLELKNLNFGEDEEGNLVIISIDKDSEYYEYFYHANRLNRTLKVDRVDRVTKTYDELMKLIDALDDEGIILLEFDDLRFVTKLQLKYNSERYAASEQQSLGIGKIPKIMKKAPKK